MLGVLISNSSSTTLYRTVTFCTISSNHRHSHEESRKSLCAKGSPKRRFMLTCGWFWFCIDKTRCNGWNVYFPPCLSWVPCSTVNSDLQRVKLPERFKKVLHQFIKKSICKHRENIKVSVIANSDLSKTN